MTKAQVRASILKMNYDVERTNRLRSGDTEEVACKAAEIVVMEIRANLEESDRR